MEQRNTSYISSNLEEIANRIICLTLDDEILTKRAVNGLQDILFGLTGQRLDVDVYLSQNMDQSDCFAEYIRKNEDILDEISENYQIKSVSKGLNEDILIKLQKISGSKFKTGDMIRIASDLSEKLKLKIQQRDKKSKARLVEWFSKNWEAVEPHLLEIYKKNDD